MRVIRKTELTNFRQTAFGRPRRKELTVLSLSDEIRAERLGLTAPYAIRHAGRSPGEWGTYVPTKYALEAFAEAMPPNSPPEVSRLGVIAPRGSARF